MSNIEKKIENLVEPIIKKMGYELYDLIYEKEAKEYYLRIFIDKKEGITLEDCEKVNNNITDILDEKEYIKNQYFLEISSPGIERLIRREKHFQENIGKEIKVKLFNYIEISNEDKIIKTTKNNNIENNKTNKKKTNLINKIKELNGILESFDKDTITINIEEKNIKLNKINIATIRTVYHW